MTFARVGTLCAVLLLGGCGTLVKDRSQVPLPPIGGFGSASGSPRTTPPEGSDKATWRNADVVTLDLPRLMNAYSGSQAASFETALAAFSVAGTPDQRKGWRNEIVNAVIMASEKNCSVYLEYLHGNQIAIKSISSVSATLLSGAAAVTTPTRSAQLLAAMGSAATGVGANLSESIFSNRAAEVIASGIQAERATLRAQINRSLPAPYDTWPLTAALTDAVAFHSRCNAISGLAYLQASAENTKSKAEIGASVGEAATKNPPGVPPSGP